MKRILILFLFVSSLIQGQYSVKGKMHPVKNYTWALLYKVEGARQTFIKNTQIKQEVQQVNGKKLTVGTLEFELPADAKVGAYRVTYDLKENGYVDFLFNKENVEFKFNPDDTEKTTVFSKSKENILYTGFLNEISAVQYKTDSIQLAYFKSPTKQIEEDYQTSLVAINNVQKKYHKLSKGTLVSNFIKASDRYNAPQIAKSSQKYVDGAVAHFFDKIDFTNIHLYNSSFLIDRIADYVFYMNHSQDPVTQEKLHKKAIGVVIEKAIEIRFKADVIEFFISQFASIKNSVMVDYLIEAHFDKLPKEYQNVKFKNKTLESLELAIGRIAPDFSWQENGKKMRLSSLKDGQNYLLIFYSTECSHCIKEVPQVFEFMKGKNKTKVIAFAMETTEKTWLNYKKTLSGWHHVLGLGKWENTIARKYQIISTPTYFVLGTDKKIIANPEKLEDLKLVLNELN